MLIRVHSLLFCLFVAMAAYGVFWTASPSAVVACPNHSHASQADRTAATSNPVVAVSRAHDVLADALSGAGRFADPALSIGCPAEKDGPWAGQCCCDDTMRVAATPREPAVASASTCSQSKIANALMVEAECVAHQLLERRTPLDLGSDVPSGRPAILATTHRLRI